MYRHSIAGQGLARKQSHGVSTVVIICWIFSRVAATFASHQRTTPRFQFATNRAWSLEQVNTMLVPGVTYLMIEYFGAVSKQISGVGKDRRIRQEV
jgi:hypothetical protein